MTLDTRAKAYIQDTWTSNDVVAFIEARDKYPGSIIKYKIDSGEWLEAASDYTKTIIFDAEGEHRLIYKAIDGVGNSTEEAYSYDGGITWEASNTKIITDYIGNYGEHRLQILVRYKAENLSSKDAAFEIYSELQKNNAPGINITCITDEKVINLYVQNGFLTEPINITANCYYKGQEINLTKFNGYISLIINLPIKIEKPLNISGVSIGKENVLYYAPVKLFLSLNQSALKPPYPRVPSLAP